MPSQPGTSGNALDFDQNEAVNGTGIAHTAGGTDLTIQNPGYYYVAFHGSISPISGSDFPLTVTLYLEQNGNIVQGTPAHYTFQTSSDTGNVSFSQIVQTTESPTTLRVVGEGGNYLYTNVSLSVYKLGEA